MKQVSVGSQFPFPHEASTSTIGGMPIAVVTRAQTAKLMLEAAYGPNRGIRPMYFTSANGEVLARAASDHEWAKLVLVADHIVADGQPLVIASRWLCRNALPERVATTDLFHDVAKLAQQSGLSFYLFGASPAENVKATEQVLRAYPDLKVVGNCHGFLEGEPLAEKLREIDALAPDILWLAMGVPREQEFVSKYSNQLRNVGVIKTSGGLFNFLSGTRPRAPIWMQRIGLEWAFRLMLEPRRLLWRYFSTNPRSAFLILTKSR